MTQQQYNQNLGIALVTLLGLALRLHHLDYDSLFMDEIRQVSYYSHSFLDIIMLAASQTQPPLDYWIGKIFFSISHSDFSVRLPAALFGTATVFLLTRMSVEKSGLSIGLVLGTYLAISHFHIYYSQEARPYSLAIFLFVLLLYVLDRIISNPSPAKYRYLALFVTTLLFLHSRTLTPLLASSVLTAFLLVTAFAHRKDTALAAGYWRSMGVMVAAIICYLPAFINIYSSNIRYLSGAPDIKSMFVSGLQGLSPDNIWPVVSVQSGNAGPLMLVLALALPFLVYRTARDRKGHFWLIMLAYTCALLLAHFFIHHARSHLPLRPPYAFYLLPLLVLLSGAALKYIHVLIVNRIRPGLFIGFLVLAFIVPQAISTYTFKQMKIRADWRSLASFALHNLDQRHLMLFETHATHNHWHPGAYGFMRYAHGPSHVTDLDYLIQHTGEDLPLNPVIVLFHYRNYLLTPSAKHGVMPIPVDDPVPITGTQLPDGVGAINYPGFSIYYLSRYTGSLRTDATTLLKALVENMAPDSASVKSRLALVMLGDSSKTHKLEQINNLKAIARPSQSRLIDNAIEILNTTQ